jgi:hypothetical protein
MNFLAFEYVVYNFYNVIATLVCTLTWFLVKVSFWSLFEVKQQSCGEDEIEVSFYDIVHWIIP